MYPLAPTSPEYRDRLHVFNRTGREKTETDLDRCTENFQFKANLDSYIAQRTDTIIAKNVDDFFGRYLSELYDALYTNISKKLDEKYVTKEEYNKQLDLIFPELKRVFIEEVQKDSTIRAHIMTMINGELDYRGYIDKEEYLHLERMLLSLKEDVHTTIPNQMNDIVQQCAINTSKKNYLFKPMGLAIVITSLITLTSALISIYLFTLGNPADISFLFSVILGIGTTIFLTNEYLKKEGKYGEK
jgi:hypothetical protein